MSQFFVQHRAEVLTLTLEHLWLVVISIALAVAIGVPLGILLSRRARWRNSGSPQMAPTASLPTSRSQRQAATRAWHWPG